MRWNAPYWPQVRHRIGRAIFLYQFAEAFVGAKLIRLPILWGNSLNFGWRPCIQSYEWRLLFVAPLPSSCRPTSQVFGTFSDACCWCEREKLLPLNHIRRILGWSLARRAVKLSFVDTWLVRKVERNCHKSNGIWCQSGPLQLNTVKQHRNRMLHQ